MRLSRRFAAMLAAWQATAGCYPMLSHDPHVEPGLTIAVHSGAELAQRTREGSAGTHGQLVIPSTQLQAALGLRTMDDLDPAVRIAIGYSGTGAQFDGYYEMPGNGVGGTAAGFGVAGQAGYIPAVLAYAELGREVPPSASWFTTQAVGYVRTGSTPRWHFVWMPTIALAGLRRGQKLHVFLTGVVGGRGGDCAEVEGCASGRNQRTYLLVGLAQEISFSFPYGRQTRRR